MQLARTIADLKRHLTKWRNSGARIGLVPTMGALHKGHMALVGAARARGDRVVATIFVNPKQFAPSEDLGAYPRREAADLDMLRGAGADLAFVPGRRGDLPAGFCHAGAGFGLDRRAVRRPPRRTFRRRRDRRRQAPDPIDAGRGLFRRKGLPAADGDPPARPRPRPAGSDRGGCDRARGRRAGAVVAQRLFDTGGAQHSPRARPDLARDRCGGRAPSRPRSPGKSRKDAPG